jgi:hypothetical protein
MSLPIENEERKYLIGSEENYRYWNQKYEKAVELMKSRIEIPSILIEIAAQHPLDNGKYPNKEFAKRLLFGKELYEKVIKDGKNAKIYVPGSRHVYNGIADEISLSDSGTKFLFENGVPKENLYGEDLNKKYKSIKGVYNSADECFVAASFFKENNFGKLYSICSPAQMMRKTIHYLEFGVLPLNFTVPLTETYHNYFYELFEAIPYALFIDPDMQNENSTKANKMRSERTPEI